LPYKGFSRGFALPTASAKFVFHAHLQRIERPTYGRADRHADRVQACEKAGDPAALFGTTVPNDPHLFHRVTDAGDRL
jgi:phosphoketolase